MLAPIFPKAQNIQLHYDFGSLIYADLNKSAANRPQVTTTLEMFRPDAGGSTFFFVDMDYSRGVFGAYWEISREFNFWQSNEKVNWLSAHIEYDGGLNAQTRQYSDAWLVGPTYSGHSQDYSKTWSLSVMYKMITDYQLKPSDPTFANTFHNFQITGVWGINFAHGWCTFSGFIDFWREVRAWQNTKYILLSEPQFWVNLSQIPGWDKVKLSLGSEVELSLNFVNKGFYAIPTIAAKYDF